ncbi:hypothetical protein [Maliponia aquimaris]|uniref:Uncharacterized protein n=1 Tax=Maliponia aquimaris TaxID=1673631 RepID=A0A238K7U8_9RHOB|nr:hypothetical protein [Maliponia aquimaris]SMX38991.1 hypothetical protein MAA8898_01824 [Maliponia aquimaris]
MAENDLFEGIEFAKPDDENLRRLRHALDRGAPAKRDAVSADLAATLVLGRALRSMGAGCRLAAPPSQIFEVSAGEGGDLVTRCGHDPYHEWHGRKRVK